MAAPIGPDRKLAAEVRRLALNKMKAILGRPAEELRGHDKQLHDALLLKLAGSVLPRLNEITGEDGQPLKISFDPAFNAVTSTPEASSSESSPLQDSESGQTLGEDNAWDWGYGFSGRVP